MRHLSSEHPLQRRWLRCWRRVATLPLIGHLAPRCGAWLAPPHFGRAALASWHRRGLIERSAQLAGRDLLLGDHLYIGARVLLLQRRTGGAIRLGDRVHLYHDCSLQSDRGASLTIGAGSAIHAGTELNAYVAPITIGQAVMIASGCRLFSYDHSIAAGRAMSRQPLRSRGPIVVEEGAWIGAGATLLSGITIGRGAVVGAASLVNRDVPAGAVVAGNPARLIGWRGASARVQPHRQWRVGCDWPPSEWASW